MRERPNPTTPRRTRSEAVRSPRRRGLPGVAVVLLLIVASLAGPGAPSGATPPSAGPLNARTVATGQITAHDGAFWAGSSKIVLKGVNQEVGVTDPELVQLAGWGFNAEMLHIHWTDLEKAAPTKNPDGTWKHTYDANYVTKIKNMVASSRQHGLYVLMKSTWCSGTDCPFFGFPAWLYEAPYNSHGVTYAQTVDGLNLAATDFWSDALRKQFMTDMWAYLAGQLKSTSGIVGYEVMNEPNAGTLPSTPANVQMMLDYQLSVATAIRAADPPRVVFFATHAGYGPGLARADLSGRKTLGNAAFDLHDYFGGRWGDGLLENPSNPNHEEVYQVLYFHRLADSPPPYFGTTASQQRFLGQAQAALSAQGIALLVGEFGDDGPNDPGAFVYFGTVTSALKNLGLSWCAFYGGNLGITDGTNLYPWGQIVVDAAKA